MWLLKARMRLILPEPVTLKRFFAPLCVFIFMGTPSFRRQNHRHGFSFQAPRALDLADVREVLSDAVEHCLAELRMRDLPTTEHHRHLDLVLLLEESAGMPGLRIEVMVVDAGTELHFLQLDDVLLLLGDSSLFRHLELVLAVVHDADHRRARGCGNFDEIEALLFGHAERRIDLENAKLRTVCPDDANGTDADHAV